MGITVFDFEDFTVRVVETMGQPWFVAKDVCRCLGISAHRRALQRIPEDEKTYIESASFVPESQRGCVKRTPFGADDDKRVISVDTPGGNQRMVAVNEPGLYRLIFSSRKKSAERFKTWVFHEVLPSIRRQGYYDGRHDGRQAAEKEGFDAEEMQAKLQMIREARLTLGRKPAQSLWLKLGLPDVLQKKTAAGDYNDRRFGEIQRFLNEATEPEPNGKVWASDLYNHYIKWADRNNAPTMIISMFGKFVRRAGVLRGRDASHRFYRGVAIKSLETLIK